MGSKGLFVCIVTLLAGVFVAHAATPPATTTSTAAIEPPPKYWIRIHGFLMWGSMGFLMPLAILLVRFSKRARERNDTQALRKLVYVHIFIQTIAVLASIAGAAVGVAKFGNKFPYTHERLGLALYVVVWLAPLVGLIRPKHGVRSRPAWYATHWLLGTAGVVLGFINIYIGMHVYELIFSTSLRTLNILFSVQLALMGVVYLATDRWQYLREQGTAFSKPVAPMYVAPKAQEHDEHNHHANIQIIPSE